MAECTFGARGPGDRLWTFISSFRVSRASFLRRVPGSAWASSRRRACHVLGGGECYTVFSVQATPWRQKTLVGLDITLIPALRQAARVHGGLRAPRAWSCGCQRCLGSPCRPRGW